ncbi:uncharacterized protein LOC134288086 [Aedes albopictus]|uniref:Integrase catalytic domain-containing protein n=1 Tax=Aedes albopictus TaxID=7160 RepID=A0ABM1YB17_AEDAL
MSDELFKIQIQIQIMRMKTRIAACQFATEDAKNPIILPRQHHITTLIINHYHNSYHHQNHETVINELRQKYQIARLRSCYSQVRQKCQRCMNERVKPTIPIMADLPPGRLAAFCRPFTHVGVDYFGPIEVVVGRRREKRWGMLATCLTIRAIHIELVHSLSTDSCIMALQNFIARRGQPRKIYSDRGTNFVGANRELQNLQTTINHDEIMRESTTTDTEWVFNPPLAPHMGGSWERLIRTVKNNLSAICFTKALTDEVLRNLLIEIENTVNCRPLTHVPVDDDSGPALTPNHFLAEHVYVTDPSEYVLETMGNGLPTGDYSSVKVVPVNQAHGDRRYCRDCRPEATPELLAKRKGYFYKSWSRRSNSVSYCADSRRSLRASGGEVGDPRCTARGVVSQPVVGVPWGSLGLSHSASAHLLSRSLYCSQPCEQDCGRDGR